MSFLKRIGLFVLTNILVILTIEIVISVLGIQPYLTASGINYGNLAAFCLVWGMGGAFISLQLSRWMAKTMLGVQVVGGAGSRGNPQYAWLVEMVEQLSRRAGLSVTPEVGVYPSSQVNAFATGPSKDRSLVAFSTGILQQMSRDEIEGVAAHEIAHIVNGDMVTMTLIQGVVNAFVMFLSRAIAFVISQSAKEENRAGMNFMVRIVLEIGLSILGMIVVMWFSRQREYRADRGSAQLAGRQKMIAALQSLGRNLGISDGRDTSALATLMISGKQGSFLSLFASHPSIEERIERLKRAA